MKNEREINHDPAVTILVLVDYTLQYEENVVMRIKDERRNPCFSRLHFAIRNIGS